MNTCEGFEWVKRCSSCTTYCYPMTFEEMQPCSPISQCFGQPPKCEKVCDEATCSIVPIPKCKDVEDTVKTNFEH